MEIFVHSNDIQSYLKRVFRVLSSCSCQDHVFRVFSSQKRDLDTLIVCLFVFKIATLMTLPRTCLFESIVFGEYRWWVSQGFGGPLNSPGQPLRIPFAITPLGQLTRRGPSHRRAGVAYSNIETRTTVHRAKVFIKAPWIRARYLPQILHLPHILIICGSPVRIKAHKIKTVSIEFYFFFKCYQAKIVLQVDHNDRLGAQAPQ